MNLLPPWSLHDEMCDEESQQGQCGCETRWATRQATHWVGCWRAHHECAIAIIERVVDSAIEDGIRRLIQFDGEADA